METVQESKQIWFPLTCSLLSSVFASFYFLSTRRIGQTVHPSVKTMYLGIIGTIISVATIAIKHPTYYEFWKPQYTIPQAAVSFVIGAFFWATRSAHSISSEHIKAANIASFGFISVIISYIGSLTLNQGSHPIRTRHSLFFVQLSSSTSTTVSPEVFGILLIAIGLYFVGKHNLQFDQEQGYVRKEGLCCNCKSLEAHNHSNCTLDYEKQPLITQATSAINAGPIKTK